MLEEVLSKLSGYIDSVPAGFNRLTQDELMHKPAPGKWSKKEILGHLIDSAINNLKRFTEVQFLPQPYTVIRYRQDDLVQVNKYQQLPLENLLQLWSSLNKQIVSVIENIPPEKLIYTVVIPNGESRDLAFLITDYADHLVHHLKQVFA